MIRTAVVLIIDYIPSFSFCICLSCLTSDSLLYARSMMKQTKKRERERDKEDRNLRQSITVALDDYRSCARSISRCSVQSIFIFWQPSQPAKWWSIIAPGHCCDKLFDRPICMRARKYSSRPASEANPGKISRFRWHWRQSIGEEVMTSVHMIISLNFTFLC